MRRGGQRCGVSVRRDCQRCRVRVRRVGWWWSKVGVSVRRDGGQRCEEMMVKVWRAQRWSKVDT